MNSVEYWSHLSKTGEKEVVFEHHPPAKGSHGSQASGGWELNGGEDVDCGARSGLNSILGLTLSWAGSAGRGSQAPPPVPTPKTATQPAIQTGRATFAKLFPPIMLSCILRTHDTSRVPQVQLAKNCLGNQVAGGVEAVGIGSLSFLPGTSGGMKRAESLGLGD